MPCPLELGPDNLQFQTIFTVADKNRFKTKALSPLSLKNTNTIRFFSSALMFAAFARNSNYKNYTRKKPWFKDRYPVTLL